MKKFNIQLIGFLGILFGIICLFQIVYSNKPYTALDIFYNESILKLHKRSDKVKVIFLGDSFGYYGINPKNSNTKVSYFNYCFPSEPIFNIYYKFKYLLEKTNIVPKRIYIIGNAQMFLIDRAKFNFKLNDKRFLLHYQSDFFWNLDFKNKASYIFNNFDIFRLGKRKYIKDTYNEYQNEFGTGIRNYQIDSITEQDIKEYTITRKDINRYYSPEVLDYYKKLDKLCIENKIDLRFYIMPTAYVFSERIKNYFKYEADAASFLKSQFPHRHNINLAKADLLITDFSDRGHLNKKGSEKLFRYFRILDRDLLD